MRDRPLHLPLPWRSARARLGAALATGIGIVTYACISAAAPPLNHPLARAQAAHDGGVMLGEVGPSAVAAVETSVAGPRDGLVEDVRPRHPRTVVNGEATYYADKFEGRRTASGLRFRQDEMYAAHRTFPFGTVLRVTNERNGRSVIVRVVDRGPWGAAAKRRNTILDVSRTAAEQLDFIRAGRTRVRIEVLLLGSGV